MIKKVKHKTLSPHIYGLRFWLRMIDPAALKLNFDDLLSKAGFKVLNFSEHFFPVQGYTAIWLLAESHLAIHTFPENEWTYIELSGCNKEKTKHFKSLIDALKLESTWETNELDQSYPIVSGVSTNQNT